MSICSPIDVVLDRPLTFISLSARCSLKIPACEIKSGMALAFINEKPVAKVELKIFYVTLFILRHGTPQTR